MKEDASKTSRGIGEAAAEYFRPSAGLPGSDMHQNKEVLKEPLDATLILSHPFRLPYESAVWLHFRSVFKQVWSFQQAFKEPTALAREYVSRVISEGGSHCSPAPVIAKLLRHESWRLK